MFLYGHNEMLRILIATKFQSTNRFTFKRRLGPYTFRKSKELMILLHHRMEFNELYILLPYLQNSNCKHVPFFERRQYSFSTSETVILF